MEVATLIIVAIFIVLILDWLSSIKSSLKGLPGPWTNALPIVGSLPILSSKPFVKLTELSKKYGPLYRLRLGSIDVVIMTDFKTMKDAFAKEAFMGRPEDLPFEHKRDTIRTQAFIGRPWKEQREFLLHYLRDLGHGTSKMEEHFKEEIQEMCRKISLQDGEPLMYSSLLEQSIYGSMASFFFGIRVQRNGPKWVHFCQLIQELCRILGPASWDMFFPWLSAIMNQFNVGIKRKRERVVKEAERYIKSHIQEHESTMDPNNIRDFMDGFILEIQKNSKDRNTAFRNPVLIDFTRLYFGTAAETIKMTTEWLLLICSAYPDVQKKIHLEIDKAIGQERFPIRNDHINMPFTEAAILELLRWKTLFPLLLMRQTIEDTELNGHFIPKDTHLLPVLWAVHHDIELWGEDVHEYKPERFLSSDGSKLVKPDFDISYSTGIRSCPGQPLGETEVFLYFTAILQQFEVKPAPGKEIDLEEEPGIFLLPKKQEICFKRRHS